MFGLWTDRLRKSRSEKRQHLSRQNPLLRIYQISCLAKLGNLLGITGDPVGLSKVITNKPSAVFFPPIDTHQNETGRASSRPRNIPATDNQYGRSLGQLAL